MNPIFSATAMNGSSNESDENAERSDPIMRAVHLTFLVNVAVALLTLFSHGPGLVLLCGLIAGQTALLATRVGIGDELLSLRLWNAQVGLVLHVAVIGLFSFGAGMEPLAIALAALSAAMVGVTLVTWLENVGGIAVRLRSEEEEQPNFHFSVYHLFIAMTAAALLMLLCRWAALFGGVSQSHLLLFALHQLIVMAVAVFCFGRFRSRRLAGAVFICVSIAAGPALESTYLGMIGSTSDFVTFEIAQASIVVLWLSAWRRAL